MPLTATEGEGEGVTESPTDLLEKHRAVFGRDLQDVYRTWPLRHDKSTGLVRFFFYLYLLLSKKCKTLGARLGELTRGLSEQNGRFDSGKEEWFFITDEAGKGGSGVVFYVENIFQSVDAWGTFAMKATWEVKAKAECEVWHQLWKTVARVPAPWRELFEIAQQRRLFRLSTMSTNSSRERDYCFVLPRGAPWYKNAITPTRRLWVSVLRQVVALHALGYAHRDLRKANIVFLRSPLLWGISRPDLGFLDEELSKMSVTFDAQVWDSKSPQSKATRYDGHALLVDFGCACRLFELCQYEGTSLRPLRLQAQLPTSEYVPLPTDDLDALMMCAALSYSDSPLLGWSSAQVFTARCRQVANRDAAPLSEAIAFFLAEGGEDWCFGDEHSSFAKAFAAIDNWTAEASEQSELPVDVYKTCLQALCS